MGRDGLGRQVAVVTVSDGVAHGARDDLSGDGLAGLLTDRGYEIVARRVVADERPLIASVLSKLADGRSPRLIVVTGGTGLAPRDVTPEATLDVIEREAPGLADRMRAVGRSSTPMADLSRGVCGVRGSTLILNVPGSPNGAMESLKAVLELIPHALDLLGGNTAHNHGPSGHATTDVAMDAVCGGVHTDGGGRTGHTFVAVYVTPPAWHLLVVARMLGLRAVLVEPDDGRVAARYIEVADEVVSSSADIGFDAMTDVVITDQDREDLVDQLHALLSGGTLNSVGLVGLSRHEQLPVEALRARGLSDEEIGRAGRTIGPDTRAMTPAEAAVAVHAALMAARGKTSP